MEVRVKATPGASKELVREITASDESQKHSDIRKDTRVFEIYVREPAQKNMANNRIRAIIAEKFGVPISAVRIQYGHRSRNKIISIL